MALESICRNRRRRAHKSAFYVTGPFVAMINYMLMRDLKQFSLIYLIFLHAFAQCTFFANGHQPLAVTAEHAPATPALATNASEPSSAAPPPPPLDQLAAVASWFAQLGRKYLDLWLELFKMTLGVYEFQPYRNSVLSRLFLMLFMHLIPILFNM